VSAQPSGLTYDEVREWAIMLGTFTAWDLARAMGVSHEIGRKAVGALLMQEMCRNTGDMVDGPEGYEHVVQYVPPPPGPSKREASGPDPEQTAIRQAGKIAVERGTPVRIRTERKQRKSLSTPGARQFHKNRERNYQLQKEAKEKRAEAQKLKSKRGAKK
jgi:hypothetical protein